MRMNFVAVFILAWTFFSNATASAHNDVKPDTVSGGQKKVFLSPESSFHFSFTYGRANFDTRTGVVSAYTESGYPYHVISQADPSAKSGRPLVLSVSAEKNIFRRVFIGLQWSHLFSQKIAGSNWMGADSKTMPVERFDVKESYSSNFVNGTVNYIVVPINFVHSRWELTVGGGMSYNVLKVTGIQRFERRPVASVVLDDTSASYKRGKKGIGFLGGGSMDFYWSHHISNQFKLEYRFTPSIKVPSQTYTYVTTRSRVRLTDTQTLKKHKVGYSGVILSFSLRFHI